MMKRKKCSFAFLMLIAVFIFPACTNPGRVSLEEPASTVGFQDGIQIIPDAELPYSPAQLGFDAAAFISEQRGYLQGYSEEVDGVLLSGAQIVEQVSLYYSVNPRLLLALLEYRAGWVSQSDPAYRGKSPLFQADSSREGLFTQLSWAANTLNRGYYTHEVNAFPSITLADGEVVALPAALNDASAALYYLFGTMLGHRDWELALSPLGFFSAYVRLFGDPFQYDMGALLPDGLVQPALQFPFAQGEGWHFTGGPHSAWGDGAAWAALDFSPPGEEYGCFTSDAWVRAMADGMTYMLKMVWCCKTWMGMAISAPVGRCSICTSRSPDGWLRAHCSRLVMLLGIHLVKAARQPEPTRTSRGGIMAFGLPPIATCLSS